MGWSPYDVPDPVVTGDCYYCRKTTEATTEDDSICGECELPFTDDDPDVIIEFLIEENDKKEKRLNEWWSKRLEECRAEYETKIELAVLESKLEKFGEDIKAEMERIANLPKIRGKK